MYSVYIESLQGTRKNLYYPADSEYVIADSVLSMEVGAVGEFTFKVPDSNPSASEIKQGEIITIMRDGKEFWRGEVRTISSDFNKTLEVYCVEDLAWLADEYLWVLHYTNRTYAQMFQMWLDEYNRRSSTRTFSIGMITNHSSADICDFATNYDMSVLDALRANICGEDGFLRVRRVTANGAVTRYIDCVKLEDYGSMASQEIRFGENLLSYVREMDMSNFTNKIYPFGAELDTEVYEGQPERLSGTQYENSASIQAFGRHAKTVVFDTDDLTTLNNLAQAYITRYSQPQITFELSAVDMAEVNASVEHFNLGDSVRVIAEAYAVDQRVYITNMEINLQDIAKNEIVMSGHAPEPRTLTQQTVNQGELIKTIPSESSILDAAKKNAFEILEGTDGGYVHFEKNENDIITAIVITNASTDTQSTRKWVFNSGGLGHYTRESTADSWSTVNVAITMDGTIAAEAIAAGTMTGQTIQGAVIQTLQNGKIESERSDTSKVTINGGMLDIRNTDGSYLNIHHTNGKLVTIGGDRWGCYNGSAWRWFDPMDLFQIVNERPWNNN